MADTFGPDGTSFVRPFLDRALGAKDRRTTERAPVPAPTADRAAAAADGGHGHDGGPGADAHPGAPVRPYFVTGGRTQAARPIAIEALVQLSAHGERAVGSLHFERRAIADVVRTPVSLAEVAARVGVPLGVARVLVADMANDSLVVLHEASLRLQDDIALITRLINGVRAL